MRFTGTYPEDWRDIAQGVKEEAGWRCIRCGHPDPPQDIPKLQQWRAGRQPCDEHCSHEKDDRQRVLTVHHFDNDKANVQWWNLGALCQVCHLQIQAKVVMPQQYLWHHTAWFRPFVAGYYAATVLKIEMTREEVEGRIGEVERLLKLGQPHLDYEEAT